jgi:hypothetical protein
VAGIWAYLKHRNDQKVNVGDARELLKDILRNERQHRILGRSNLIVWVLELLIRRIIVDMHSAQLRRVNCRHSRVGGDSAGTPKILLINRYICILINRFFDFVV